MISKRHSLDRWRGLVADNVELSASFHKNALFIEFLGSLPFVNHIAKEVNPQWSWHDFSAHPEAPSAPPWGVGETGFEFIGKIEGQIAVADQDLEL